MHRESSNVVQVYQGADHEIPVRILRESNHEPFALEPDLEEVTAVFTLKNGQTLEKKMSDGGVTVVSAPLGRIRVVLTPADTDQLHARDRQDFDVKVEIGGKTTIVRLFRALTVIARAGS